MKRSIASSTNDGNLKQILMVKPYNTRLLCNNHGQDISRGIISRQKSGRDRGGLPDFLKNRDRDQGGLPDFQNFRGNSRKVEANLDSPRHLAKSWGESRLALTFLELPRKFWKLGRPPRSRFFKKSPRPPRSRPDFCRDIIPLEISRTYLVQSEYYLQCDQKKIDKFL